MTTLITIRTAEKTVMAAEGNTIGKKRIIKRDAKKVLCLYNKDKEKILVSHTGYSAQGAVLMGWFAEEIKKTNNLLDATTSVLANLCYNRDKKYVEGGLLIADRDNIMGMDRDVVTQYNDGLAAAGSGSPYAIAAARALLRNTDMDAEEIAREAVRIACEYDPYSGGEIMVETIEREDQHALQKCL